MFVVAYALALIVAYQTNDYTKYVRPDFRRLANAGDLNIEISRDDLRLGSNQLDIFAKDSQGDEVHQTVTIRWHEKDKSTLPYRIDWSDFSTIQEAVQVVDGLWKLTPEGIRIVEPYARALVFGDSTWRNYELCARVKFHGIRRPGKRDGGRKYIHAALAARWPGHGVDKNQPHLKWHPVGAMCEFMLQTHPEPCRWRILGGPGKKEVATNAHAIEWDKWYVMKLRVTTTKASSSLYSVKLWEADLPEPESWDVEFEEDPDDVVSGGAMLVAHYSDVTFGNISVEAVDTVK